MCREGKQGHLSKKEKKINPTTSMEKTINVEDTYTELMEFNFLECLDSSYFVVYLQSNQSFGMSPPPPPFSFQQSIIIIILQIN